MSTKKAVIRSDMTRAQWTWKEMKKNWVAYVMVFPYMFLFTLFTVVPVLLSIVISFTDFNLLELPNFVFLDNFIKLLDNSAFKMAAKNTLQFSFTAVPLAVVLAMGLALMLECRIPGKSRFRTFFLSPMMVPVASVVLIWQVLFGYNGTVNEFIMLFGAERIDWLQSDYCQC